MTDRLGIDPFEERLTRLLVLHTEIGVGDIDALDVARAAAAQAPARRVRWPGVALRLPVLGRARLAITIAVVALAAIVATAGVLIGGRTSITLRPVLVSRDGIIVAIDPERAPERSLGAGQVPVWSPDGSSIAFQLGEDVWVMRADGSDRRLVAKASAGPVAWSPDSTSLLVPYPRYRVVSIDAGTATDLFYPPWKDSGGGTWSPDGTRVALVIDRDKLIVEEPGQGSAAQRIASAGGLWQPTWSPDGTTIAYDSDVGLRTVAPDGSGDHQVSPHRDSAWARSLAWDAAGDHLAYAELGSGAHVVDVATGDDRIIFAPEQGRSVTSVAWAPDGVRLVVVMAAAADCGIGLQTVDVAGGPSGAPVTTDAWIVNADGSDARLLAKDIDCSFLGSVDW